MRITDPEAVELDLRVWAKQSAKRGARRRRLKMLNWLLTPVCALVVYLVIHWMVTK